MQTELLILYRILYLLTSILLLIWDLPASVNFEEERERMRESLEKSQLLQKAWLQVKQGGTLVCDLADECCSNRPS